jgi:Uma2 family endonuclease
MAAAPSFLSPKLFEQLYSDDRKPYFEYWFGEAIQKPMPTLLHSILQGLIFALLRERGWRAGTELRLKLSKVAYPVPDVVADSRRLEGPYPTKNVDLCVEVLSPGDKLKELFVKGAHYLDWGVSSVWIIDGEQRKAFVMSLDCPEPVELGIADSLTAGSGNSAVCIPMRVLFEEVDKELS